MSASSVSDELDSRLSLALDPFEDMCAPKSQTTFLACKVRELFWLVDASVATLHTQTLLGSLQARTPTACERWP